MVDVVKGKYRIVREIARSNDIVYEATDTALGRRIALKELNINPGMSAVGRKERIERFNREARAAGRLSHPNIVSVTDYGEENGRYFIAMEFLEGQSLRDAMQVRGAYPLQEALTIIYQVLDALAYAHANRVVHRDIKPDNIHILPGGQVKLTDFGIARLGEEPALTSDGQVFGTPSYMSPEQIEGKNIDHRSDLFSAGVLLYEMLAGRKPFVGDSVISITYAIMNAEPPPIHGIPSGIEQVIRRALAKNPNMRQVSAEQMKQDLKNAEHTPAIFLPTPFNQTGMGRTGMGGAFPAMSPNSGYGGGAYPGANTGYTGGGMSNYGAQPGYMPPMSAQPPSLLPPAAVAGNLPWSWNTPGSVGASPPPPLTSHPFPGPQTGPPGTFAGQPGQSGAFPYGAQAFPKRPSDEPLFTLSPGAKTALMSLVVAVILGTGIAVGMIALQNSYQRFQQSAKDQGVQRLMDQGVQADKQSNYAQAAKYFEQAEKVPPGASLKNTVDTDLAYEYIKLARQATANGKLQEARDDYKKALQIKDYSIAHTELAQVLQQLGDTGGAQSERSAAESTESQTPPAQLNVSSAQAPASPSNTEDPNQYIQDRSAQASQLLQEGDDLARQGQVDAAREKWQEAAEKAPGTSVSEEANRRLYPSGENGAGQNDQ